MSHCGYVSGVSSEINTLHNISPWLRESPYNRHRRWRRSLQARILSACESDLLVALDVRRAMAVAVAAAAVAGRRTPASSSSTTHTRTHTHASQKKNKSVRHRRSDDAMKCSPWTDNTVRHDKTERRRVELMAWNLNSTVLNLRLAGRLMEEIIVR